MDVFAWNVPVSVDTVRIQITVVGACSALVNVHTLIADIIKNIAFDVVFNGVIKILTNSENHETV